MTFPMRLLMILFAIGGTLRGADAGGESELPETGWATKFSDRLLSMFEESAEIDHAGLLGRVYVQSRFTQTNVPNEFMRQYDKSAEISDGLINLPLWTFDLTAPLNLDLFLGYSEAKLNGAHFPTQWYDDWPESDFSYRRERHELGITLFTEFDDRFRPFLQVGAKFDETAMLLARNYGYGPNYSGGIVWIDGTPTNLDSPNYRFVGSKSEETSLLLKPGFEFDLMESLSYRMTIDINSSVWRKRSELQNDLVFWPFRKFFVRGGVNTSFDGSYYGFSLGMGLVY